MEPKFTNSLHVVSFTVYFVDDTDWYYEIEDSDSLYGPFATRAECFISIQIEMNREI